MTVDFYEVLDVAPTAPAEEIRAAVTQQRRVWIRRQSSPDPDRRSAAEERVRQIDQAEKTLLDPARRAEFDRQRSAATGSATSPCPPTAPTGRDGSGAAAGPQSPDMSLDQRRQLGATHLRAERWERAIAEFQAVLAKQPDDAVATAGIATAYVRTRRARAGLKLLASVLKQPPQDPEAVHAVATALYDTATACMAQLRDGSILPLSRRQVAVADRHGRWIAKLNPADPTLRARADELRQVAKDARKAHWLPSRNKRWYALALLVAFVPSVVRGDVYSGNLAWALCAVIVAVYVWRHRRPTWRLRRRELRADIRSGGI